MLSQTLPHSWAIRIVSRYCTQFTEYYEYGLPNAWVSGIPYPTCCWKVRRTELSALHIQTPCYLCWKMVRSVAKKDPSPQPCPELLFSVELDFSYPWLEGDKRGFTWDANAHRGLWFQHIIWTFTTYLRQLFLNVEYLEIDSWHAGWKCQECSFSSDFAYTIIQTLRVELGMWNSAGREWHHDVCKLSRIYRAPCVCNLQTSRKWTRAMWYMRRWKVLSCSSDLARSKTSPPK